METIYLSRYLLPVSSPSLQDGALVARNGRIVALGQRKEVTAAYPQAAVVDFGDAVVLPPLVNAHTHLELTHFPDWAQKAGETSQPQSFVDWIQQVIRVKRAQPHKSYAPSLKEGICQSLAAGTGAVGDILSYFPARNEYQQAPINGRIFLETLGRDPLQNRKILKSIGAILDSRLLGNLQLGLAPHSPYTLSAEYLEECLNFASRRRIPLSLHFAEAPEEVAFLEASQGEIAERLYPFVGWVGMVPPPAHRRPLAYLADCGGLKDPLLLVHGVQVFASEAPSIAAAGASVALCPRSNARLGVGMAPVRAYLDAGVNLALGTDSLASCDTLSVWDELAFARSWFGGEVSPGELLTMATKGGARALGLELLLGGLHVEGGVNFQVLRPAALPPFAELEEFLTSSGRSSEVSELYLDGSNVLQKG